MLDPHKFEASDPAQHGVVPRACTQLFEMMAAANAEVTYVVHVSYVECYNGNLRDVLATGKHDSVVARESTNGLVLEGLSHTLVSSPATTARTFSLNGESASHDTAPRSRAPRLPRIVAQRRRRRWGSPGLAK